MIWPFTLEARRRRRLRHTLAGPLRDYLSVPFPAPSLDYRKAHYLAVDLETTGLDPRHDHILSVGYVMVHGNRIDLASAHHRLVRTVRAIPEASAVIHQITDDQAASGDALAEVLAELLAQLAGKVMIAHYADVEHGFLSFACKRIFGCGLLVPIIDTQVLARRGFERRQAVFRPSDLRLHALRARYNLPRYGAHNALSDALAAAELFLAQIAHRNAKSTTLRELLR